MDRTDTVLAAIDGALADALLPDGMRWSPTPQADADPRPLVFDGRIVPQPPQAYELPVYGPAAGPPPDRPGGPPERAPRHVGRVVVVESGGPGDRSAVAFAELWGNVARALDRIMDGIGEAMQRISDTITAPGIADALQRLGRELSPPPPRPATVEAVRAAALDTQRHRCTGPPRIGPERSPAPRGGPVAASAVVGRPRARQLARR